MKKFLQSNWSKILLAIFLLIFILISVGSSLYESLTFDEIVYLQEGRQILFHHAFSVDPYNPPLIKELAVLPYLFQKNFYTNSLFQIHYPLAAKMIIVFLGLCLLVETYILTKKYFGEKEAIFSVGLLALEPTIVANSHLVTLDIGVTLFFLIAYGLLLSIRTRVNEVLLGVVVGLGIASKLSFVPFFILSAFFVSFYTYSKKLFLISWKHKKRILFVTGISFIVVWSAYLFQFSPIIKQRKDNTRISQKLVKFSVSHHIPLLGQFVSIGEYQKLPLGDFLAIDKNTLLRKAPSSCFFFGKYYSSCLPYFLFVNLLIKLPLPLVVFAGVSLLLYFKDKQHRKRTTIFLIPFLAILVASSLSGMQPLVRYVLPAYPFLILFSAGAFEFWQKNMSLKIIFAGLCIWYVMSTTSSFPHFLGYANELVGYQQDRYLFLTDSNFDWGQSLPDVSKFIKRQKPSAISLSYFGRDNGNWYGLKSDKAYMSYKNPEICEFHNISFPKSSGTRYILISSSNWYGCGYYEQEQFAKKKIKGILGGTILVF